MARNLFQVLAVLVFVAALCTPAFPFGEDVLAVQGEYTFFIKPDPCSDATFYQKMVPCVEKKTIGVPRRIVERFPFPVPDRRRPPVLIEETPLGTPHGVSPCIECSPRPSCRPGRKDVIVPLVVDIRVPGVDIRPKCVSRKIRLPQWFMIKEHPKPPSRKVTKVGPRG